MKRCKFTVNMRNKLAMLAMDCESAAALEARMTNVERTEIQEALRKVVNYIDKETTK